MRGNPTRYRAWRDGRQIWLEIPPDHPRFAMSFAKEVKEPLDEESRYVLAEKLAEHVTEALRRWADDPVPVNVVDFGRVYGMAEHPHRPGRVLVTLISE